MRLEIYCDGGARGNPGPAAIGFIVKKDEEIIHQHGEAIGMATNNIAEYTAVSRALDWLKENSKFQIPCLAGRQANSKFQIIFYLDSKLVVEQLSGRYKIKNPNLKNLWSQIKTLENNLKVKIIYQNIPRSLNAKADSLVNEALDRIIL